MTFLALTDQLKPVEVPLENLYLDPNNPRFVTTEWVPISDEDIAAPDVQERTMRHMVQQFGVDKLRMSMEVNGYLPIDRVIVREFADHKYVVLEGNRRICAAKMISQTAMDGSQVSQEVLDSLQSLPVLQYTGGDTNAAWIFQGLRHISGVEDWSAFNKAKLLVEQMEEDNLSLTEVGKRFGLTPHGAGQWVRGFFAYKQAREESDFIGEVDERAYPYFQELFSRSNAALRDWMGWNEVERKFQNLINFNEFVSWLYPRPEDGTDGITQKGDWDKRRLSRRDDLREIGFLMADYPEYFQQFRAGIHLEQAYSMALANKYDKEAKEKADPVQDAFGAIRACSKALENLPLKATKDPALKVELQSLIHDLEQKILYVK